MFKRFVTCLAALIVALPLFGTTVGAQPSGTALVNADVFDGERVIRDAVITFENGIITAVGRDVAVDDAFLVIDMEGAMVLPGLIDAHTHTPFRGFAESALVFGVTTLLDMLSPAEVARELRAEQQAGRAHDRADVFSSGVAVTAPGGHGTQFGVSIPTLGPNDDPHAFVADRAAEGSDYIKVIVDDGSAYGIHFDTLDSETVAAVISAAHDHDLMAVVHVGQLSDARAVVQSGADGLVHVWSDDIPTEEDVALLAERGVFVVPTLAVMAGLGGRQESADLAEDQRIAPYLRPADHARLGQFYPRRDEMPASFEHAVESVRRLAAAGVPILAGTDAPNPGTAHGVSMHHELQLLVEAGMQPIEALRAATSAAADAFDLTDRGRIAPGMRADLLAVHGDPTYDISATLEIASIWKEGRRVNRRAFRERLAAQVGPGMVSDFEDGGLQTSFGVEWVETTDQSMGGASSVAIEVVDGGADDSSRALSITGEIVEQGPFQWSGTVVFPGGDPMTGADLSATNGIRFQVRGDAGAYSVILFSPSLGFAPVTRAFEVTNEWTEVTFTWEDFGTDAGDVTGLGVVAGAQPGPFTIYVDQFEIW